MAKAKKTKKPAVKKATPKKAAAKKPAVKKAAAKKPEAKKVVASAVSAPKDVRKKNLTLLWLLIFLTALLYLIAMVRLGQGY